jgi:hypothetical protein
MIFTVKDHFVYMPLSAPFLEEFVDVQLDETKI